MRKALIATGLALGVIGVSAGAASADPVINGHNEHGADHSHGVTVAGNDVLPNTNVNALNNAHVLDDGGVQVGRVVSH